MNPPTDTGPLRTGALPPTFPEEAYFNSREMPNTIPERIQKIQNYLTQLHSQSEKIAVVTSGGTTVPLERITTRFIDNFSMGTRGAVSGEQFLSKGYKVIFVHRKGSLTPCNRQFQKLGGEFLDNFDQDGKVSASLAGPISAAAATYHKHLNANNLVLIDFTTVHEYLFLLREIAKSLQSRGENVLYYLAAAVSDFHVPSDKMVEDKIQSGAEGITLQLDQVPKFLKPLVSGWAAKAFVASFKLETKEILLLPKSRQALQRYGHHLVIGNILTTRRKRVVMISVGAVDPHGHKMAPAQVATTPAPGVIPDELAPLTIPIPGEHLVELCLTDEEVNSGRDIEVEIVNEIDVLWKLWRENISKAMRQNGE